MATDHDLEALCNALGHQHESWATAIRHVRAIREHSENQREMLLDFLGLDDWSDEAIAPQAFITRARLLTEAAPQGPFPSRRLPQIDSDLQQISALLLESIHVTHADCLEYRSLEAGNHQGTQVHSGDFVHRKTGHRYLISVVRIAREGESS